jgi:hypothetical protein
MDCMVVIEGDEGGGDGWKRGDGPRMDDSERERQ